MEYIRITKENIDKEHICCAMSGQQSLAKKEWLKQRFEEGLVFYRSAERGKCFIEYIPAENAWVPIDAAGWLYINCLWVSGSMKGHGYSSELLEECLRDAKAQGKNGVCILCAEGRKREFLADPKFLTHKGFKVSDIFGSAISLGLGATRTSRTGEARFYGTSGPSSDSSRSRSGQPRRPRDGRHSLVVSDVRGSMASWTLGPAPTTQPATTASCRPTS